MREHLTIIKVGGKVVEEPESLKSLLKDFSRIAGHKILVHGGGKTATHLAEQLGIESKMVEGRRITDAETLKVVTMVYAGLVNKTVVAGLQSLGTNAIGLTGADLDIIRAEKRPVGDIDYGFVGDVQKVNSTLLGTLINSGIIPVFCAITHDGKGQLLNTNADTIASELAIALSEIFDVTLNYCFEKPGVLFDAEDDNSVITSINQELYATLKADGAIHSGMIPKLDNCFNSLQKGVQKIKIGHHRMLNDTKALYTTITL